MKRRTAVYVLLVAIIIVGLWYFMRPAQYCVVEYSQNPGTGALVVSCDDTHCNKTCFLLFRRKGSSDNWGNPNDSHSYDTTRWEYRCPCR